MILHNVSIIQCISLHYRYQILFNTYIFNLSNIKIITYRLFPTIMGYTTFYYKLIRICLSKHTSNTKS